MLSVQSPLAMWVMWMVVMWDDHEFDGIGDALTVSQNFPPLSSKQTQDTAQLTHFLTFYWLLLLLCFLGSFGHNSGEARVRSWV